MKRPLFLELVCLLALSLVLVACSGGSSPAPTAVAYVAHSQSHSLTVVNIPADKTVSRIQIGNSSADSLTQVASYPQQVAIPPDGKRAFISDASTSVWVVDTSSNSVIAKIDAGLEPIAMAMSSDGATLLVTSITCGNLLCSGPAHPAQMASVEVIDTAEFSLRATITLGKQMDVSLAGIAISPDGRRAYVTETVGGRIWVIDMASNSVASTIQLASTILGDASVSPDGKRLYVMSETNGIPSDAYSLEVIDTQTNTVSASIGLGSSGALALSSDGSHAYVAAEGGTLWVIDTTTNAVTAAPAISKTNLTSVALTPDGKRVYVTSADDNVIYVLDTVTNRVVNTVHSDSPGGLAIRRAG